MVFVATAVDGNIWAGRGMGTADLDGVMIFDPEGQLIGRIALPERCANLCRWSPKKPSFHGLRPWSLRALEVNAQGAVYGLRCWAARHTVCNGGLCVTETANVSEGR